jgi:hypothetical protein
MPAQQVIEYLEAFRAFKAAECAASDIAAAVAQAAEQLKSWPKLANESHTSGGAGFAPNSLPLGSKVREALETWRFTRGELFAAWKRVQKDERVGLIPPPGEED